MWPYVWAFWFLKSTHAFFLVVYDLWRLCCNPVVGKRTLHASSLCVLFVMLSFVCHPCLSLCLVVECLSELNYSLFILFWWTKVLSFIAGPKIQTRRHFLTKQIRVITYLFWSLNIFLLINFWPEFSRMLFCVFSRLVEKYRSVTLTLIRFWSKISRMFLSMFLGVIILRLKQCVFYISNLVYEDIDTWLTKAWTAINRLSIIGKSYLTDKMKRSFFKATVVSILLYGCTTWTLNSCRRS